MTLDAQPRKSLAIVYGSTTGNTQRVAELLQKALGDRADAVADISSLTPADLTTFDFLILGVPTWNTGEMQDHWADALASFDSLPADAFAGKAVAVFGLGDFRGYPDTYVDAMGELWDAFRARGAALVGRWPTADYDFVASKAVVDGAFLGLVIDVENQDGLTDDRVATWADQLRGEFPL